MSADHHPKPPDTSKLKDDPASIEEAQTVARLTFWTTAVSAIVFCVVVAGWIFL